MKHRVNSLILKTILIFICLSGMQVTGSFAQDIPRTPEGKPFLQGIWQAQTTAADDLEDHVARHDMPAGKGVVEGGRIPYTAAALAQKQLNFANRATDDPFSHCYLPGVPRIMALDFPFQIFQAEELVAITFEWQQVFRLIYTTGDESIYAGVPSWMGHSRGRWEEDVFVVEVNDLHGTTWLDAAGNFLSAGATITERYTMLDKDTIAYQATIDDPATFTEPWTLGFELRRQTHLDRLLEYQCQAEKEEYSGDFERAEPLWYPADIPQQNSAFENVATNLSLPEPQASISQRADGTPDITGWYMSDAGGANYGLEVRGQLAMFPPARGVVVDPADGVLPYQAWARAEQQDRLNAWRGYDDPTAHCFVAGIPRSHYVPSPFYIVQSPGYVVILYERMSYRVIPLDGREHLPDHLRLWMGDHVGRWENGTLVVESQNYNGKAWLNETGDVISHAQKVVETFTPVSDNQIIYRATVSDPIVYSRPWTLEMPFNQSDDELLEVACLEDNNDLEHLKDVRDEYRESLNENN